MTAFDNTQSAAALQDRLTGALIGLARATEGNMHMVSDTTAAVVVEGLCATLTGVSATDGELLALLDRVEGEKQKLVPNCYVCASPCGRNNHYDMTQLWNAPEEIRRLKSLILFGSRSIAAYAYQAAKAGCKDDAIHNFLYKALFAIGMDDWGEAELLPIAREAAEINRKGMALLDRATPAHNS